MAENTGAATAQGADATQPHGGATQVHGTDAQQPDAGSAESESSTVDVAELQRKLSEFEKDNNKYRKELRERDEAKRKADEAALPERERFEKRERELTQQLEEARSLLREERGKGAVVNAASALGFAKPEQAYALLTYDRSLEFDDDGRPTNVDSALKALLKDNPNLASTFARASGSADLGSKGSAPASQDMNQLMRAAAGLG